MSTDNSLYYIVAAVSRSNDRYGLSAFRLILQPWVDVVGGFDNRRGENFSDDNQISLFISVRLLVYNNIWFIMFIYSYLELSVFTVLFSWILFLKIYYRHLFYSFNRIDHRHKLFSITFCIILYLFNLTIKINFFF